MPFFFFIVDVTLIWPSFCFFPIFCAGFVVLHLALSESKHCLMKVVGGRGSKAKRVEISELDFHTFYHFSPSFELESRAMAENFAKILEAESSRLKQDLVILLQGHTLATREGGADAAEATEDAWDQHQQTHLGTTPEPTEAESRCAQDLLALDGSTVDRSLRMEFIAKMFILCN